MQIRKIYAVMYFFLYLSVCIELVIFAVFSVLQERSAQLFTDNRSVFSKQNLLCIDIINYHFLMVMIMYLYTAHIT